MGDSRSLLLAGLEQLGLPADNQKVDRLWAFAGLIEKWNNAYNLTAIRSRQDIVCLHILDSLAVHPYLQGPEIIDIGTGAGLPGIPLAIFSPENSFTLLDSNSKKTRFVQQVQLDLKLENVAVRHARAEQFEPDGNRYDTVICRALAGIEAIIDYADHLLSEHGILLAMKGQNPEEELNQLNRPFTVIPIKVPGVDADRCLVQIRNLNIQNG